MALDRAASTSALHFGYNSEDGILRGSVAPFMHFSATSDSKQSIGQFSDHIDKYRDVALWCDFYYKTFKKILTEKCIFQQSEINQNLNFNRNNFRKISEPLQCSNCARKSQLHALSSVMNTLLICSFLSLISAGKSLKSFTCELNFQAENDLELCPGFSRRWVSYLARVSFDFI